MFERNHPVPEVVRRLGVARQVAYRWYEAWQAGGEAVAPVEVAVIDILVAEHQKLEQARKELEAHTNRRDWIWFGLAVTSQIVIVKMAELASQGFCQFAVFAQ